MNEHIMRISSNLRFYYSIYHLPLIVLFQKNKTAWATRFRIFSGPCKTAYADLAWRSLSLGDAWLVGTGIAWQDLPDE